MLRNGPGCWNEPDSQNGNHRGWGRSHFSFQRPLSQTEWQVAARKRRQGTRPPACDPRLASRPSRWCASSREATSGGIPVALGMTEWNPGPLVGKMNPGESCPLKANHQLDGL